MGKSHALVRIAEASDITVKQLLVKTLRRHKGNIDETAASLCVSPRTIYYNMKRHGVVFARSREVLTSGELK